MAGLSIVKWTDRGAMSDPSNGPPTISILLDQHPTSQNKASLANESIETYQRVFNNCKAVYEMSMLAGRMALEVELYSDPTIGKVTVKMGGAFGINTLLGADLTTIDSPTVFS